MAQKEYGRDGRTARDRPGRHATIPEPAGICGGAIGRGRTAHRPAKYARAYLRDYVHRPQRGLIVNGSKLGRNKEFAANRFHELFGAHTADELEREVSGQNDERPVADSESSESSATDSPTEITEPNPMDTEAESRLIGQAVDTLDIFSTALEEGQYPEPYEEDFRPERKRRKKRRPL